MKKKEVEMICVSDLEGFDRELYESSKNKLKKTSEPFRLGTQGLSGGGGTQRAKASRFFPCMSDLLFSPKGVLLVKTAVTQISDQLIQPAP